MRLKVLGAYGASDAEHNLTGYLLDDWLAVDAGNTHYAPFVVAPDAGIEANSLTLSSMGSPSRWSSVS